MALEAIVVLFVIVAVAAERLTEMIGSPLLERYNIKSKGVRAGVLVLLVTVFNLALLAGLDLDPVSALLEENQSIFNMAIAAFTASGLSGLSHNLLGYLGKKDSIIEIAQTSVDAAEALSE